MIRAKKRKRIEKQINTLMLKIQWRPHCISDFVSPLVDVYSICEVFLNGVV